MISPSTQVVNGLIIPHLEPIWMSRTFALHDPVVRDPYARWCGRGETVRGLPIPINDDHMGFLRKSITWSALPTI
jgi:hypothetical protein